MVFPLSYPFSISKIPLKSRLNIFDIPINIKTNNMMEETIYPDIKSPTCVYIAGVTLENWNDFYCNIYIYCCEFNINNLFIVWDNTSYIRVEISNNNWKQYLGNVPCNFIEILTNEYNMGTHIPLFDISPRKTLLNFPHQRVCQMYVSPEIGKTPSSEAKHIPSINYNNISAYDIVRKTGQIVYIHSSYSCNIAKNDHVKYIKDLLIYATAHGFKGVVINCGSHSNSPLQECYNKMIENIVNGIKGSIFSPHQKDTAKLILKTSSGKGSELLSSFNDFNSFYYYIISTYPDIAPFFGICVDTSNIFNSGYIPNKYLSYILNYYNVDLVYLNDSCTTFNSKKDKHTSPGNGYIPWYYLFDTAKICKMKNIPLLYEKYL
jgi:endonuclease IV